MTLNCSCHVSRVRRNKYITFNWYNIIKCSHLRCMISKRFKLINGCQFFLKPILRCESIWQTTSFVALDKLMSLTPRVGREEDKKMWISRVTSTENISNQNSMWIHAYNGHMHMQKAHRHMHNPPTHRHKRNKFETYRKHRYKKKEKRKQKIKISLAKDLKKRIHKKLYIS